ncbi:MAG: hypothetical protein K2P95_06565 [Hyphomonadaceae bacterium]|nr:hypothetical protein [Hyphomonadaceae bacterium]
MRGLVMGVVALSVVVGSAHASGTVSGAGGADAYTRGKAIFSRKVSCDECKVPGGPNTPEEAAAVLKRVKAGEFGLDKSEQEAVAAFLERRFKVS